MDIPLKQLDALFEALSARGVTEFEWEDEAIRLRVAFQGATVTTTVAAAAVSPAASVAAPVAEEDATTAYVTSPFVGTFYRAPSPEAEPFVDVGATVRKGQVLCIVEAMKLMNEIESELTGVIMEILVDNGQSVEFGQRLFKLRRAQ